MCSVPVAVAIARSDYGSKNLRRLTAATRRTVRGACPGDGAGYAGGMKFIMGPHLTIAAKLSNDWGPPLAEESGHDLTNLLEPRFPG